MLPWIKIQVSEWRKGLCFPKQVWIFVRKTKPPHSHNFQFWPKAIVTFVRKKKKQTFFASFLEWSGAGKVYPLHQVQWVCQILWHCSAASQIPLPEQWPSIWFHLLLSQLPSVLFLLALAFCRRTHTRAALFKSSPGSGLKQDLAPQWLCGVKFSSFICWRNSSITLLLQSFYLPLANNTAKKVICLKQK